MVMGQKVALESHNQKMELMVRTRIFQPSRDLPVVKLSLWKSIVSFKYVILTRVGMTDDL